jgi:hypothetical protein
MAHRRAGRRRASDPDFAAQLIEVHAHPDGILLEPGLGGNEPLDPTKDQEMV